MQAVILVAGRGVRMGKLTENTPKPMLMIDDKPILAYKIEALPSEINEVILIVGYRKEQIIDYFGSKYNSRKITYIEQKKLNGTGGAIHLAKNILKGKFLVMMGDDLYAKEDMEELITTQDISVLGFEVGNPKRFGVIKTDENGNAVDIEEKPDMTGTALANIGLYVLNEDFFNYPLVDLGNGEFGLPQTIITMKDKYIINTKKATKWFPIGNPGNLEKAQEIISEFI